MNPAWARRGPTGPESFGPEALISLVLVAGSVGFVLLQLQPDLIFSTTTPTGGDNGGHVWAPAFLRNELLPRGRLSGWSPDFYGGFPAFRFYMVVPHLAIALLSYVAPYEVAYKVVVAIGPVTLPLAAWFAGRAWRLPWPGPGLLAVAAVAFLFDDGYELYGGNVASTMAGEFAFSLALTLTLVYVAMLGRRVGGHHGWAGPAVVLALVGLCHPLPAIFAGAVTVAAVVALRSLELAWWALRVGGVALLLAGFWIVPFWFQRSLMNDMGWPRLTTFADDLLRTDLRWVTALAAAGLLAGLIGSGDNGLARVLTGALAVMVAGVLLVPQGQLWNARLLPFVYLALFLLAGLGVAAAVTTATGRRLLGSTESWFGDRSAVRVAVGIPAVLIGAGVVADFGLGLEAGWLTELGLLAGAGSLLLGAAEGFRLLVARRLSTGRSRSLAAGVTASLFVALLVSVALPLRVLPGGTTGADGSYHWLGLSTDDENPAAGYASFDFAGMEARRGDRRGGGYDEYSDLVRTMEAVGAERGCGRAMWEYSDDLIRYGSTMALQLLPYWTDGCIGSFEGVYFESSPTVPYHFVTQAELSARPSRAMRGIDYPALDIAAGAQHLRELGVRYYLAFSDVAVANAGALLGVEEVARSGPWVVYDLVGTELVEPLAREPVVLEGVGSSVGDWTEPAMAVFRRPDAGVVIAADGPADWPEVEWTGELDPVLAATADPFAPVTVSGIETDVDSIAFRVSEPGTPVLVKASYFPTWELSGADGPYRAGPNQMVVIPTSTDVVLRHRTHWSEWLGWLATAAGLVLVGRAAWSARRKAAS